MVASSGAEADNNADRVSSYEKGMCQKFTRECWEVGSLYGSAIDAWYGAREKHPNDRTPPEGAPTYYSGGNYGHAVVSAGGGRIRSTDAPSTGKVSDQDLDWPERNWGYKYLGWTGDINGVDCPNLSDDGDNNSGDGDDDMPHYDHGVRSTNTSIKASTWTNIGWESVTPDGGAMREDKAYVLLEGRKYSAVLHVTMDAPAGSTVKMRTIESDADSGDTLESNPQTEAVATGGDTYATHTQNGSCAPDRVLRFQVTCTSNATLLGADVVVLSWG